MKTHRTRMTLDRWKNALRRRKNILQRWTNALKRSIPRKRLLTLCGILIGMPLIWMGTRLYHLHRAQGAFHHELIQLNQTVQRLKAQQQHLQMLQKELHTQVGWMPSEPITLITQPESWILGPLETAGLEWKNFTPLPDHHTYELTATGNYAALLHWLTILGMSPHWIELSALRIFPQNPTQATPVQATSIQARSSQPTSSQTMTIQPTSSQTMPSQGRSIQARSTAPLLIIATLQLTPPSTTLSTAEIARFLETSSQSFRKPSPISTDLRNPFSHLLATPSRTLTDHLYSSSQLWFYTPVYRDTNHLKALLQTAITHHLLNHPVVIASDEGSNFLMIRSEASDTRLIHTLLQHADQAIPEVHLEARIMVINQEGLKELGIQWNTQGNYSLGHLDGKNLAITGFHTGFEPITHGATLGLRWSRLPPGFQLDAALQALETEGNGKIISTPSVTVNNRQEGVIEQGKEIPYQSTTTEGATQVQFKKAVLGLRVTPQVRGDHTLELTIQINNDSVNHTGSETSSIPMIDTTELKTQLTVENLQTIVLGGISTHLTAQSIHKIPILGDIPGLGVLFRNQRHRTQQAELLVFITPKLLETQTQRSLETQTHSDLERQTQRSFEPQIHSDQEQPAGISHTKTILSGITKNDSS